VRTSSSWTGPTSGLDLRLTSGTTAVPVAVMHDRRLADQASGYYLSWLGLSPGDPILFVWYMRAAHGHTSLRAWIHRLLNIHFLPVGPIIDGESDVLRRHLESVRPRCIIGYSSLLGQLAESLLSAGGPPSFRPEAVIFSAEHMDEGMRQIVERAFRCPVLGRYGTVEAHAIIAHQCPAQDAYHINDWGYYLEVDRPADLVAPPGYGRLLITDLHNRSAPLIRYALGDLARLGSECACGYRGPVIQELIGREAECVVLPDGRRIPVRFITRDVRVAGAYEYISAFQLVQRDRSTLELHHTPSREIPAGCRRRLEEELGDTLLGQMRISFVPRDDLPREPSGKRPVLKQLAGDSR